MESPALTAPPSDTFHFAMPPCVMVGESAGMCSSCGRLEQHGTAFVSDTSVHRIFLPASEIFFFFAPAAVSSPISVGDVKDYYIWVCGGVECSFLAHHVRWKRRHGAASQVDASSSGESGGSEPRDRTRGQGSGHHGRRHFLFSWSVRAFLSRFFFFFQTRKPTARGLVIAYNRLRPRREGATETSETFPRDSRTRSSSARRRPRVLTTGASR